MSLSDELERLKNLHEQGDLSDEEYQRAKQAVLDKDESFGRQVQSSFDSFAGDEGNYAMLLHLSQFAAYLAPVAGIAVPLVLWLVKKDESEAIDWHGRMVVNWLISAFLYSIVFGLLSFVLIGIPLLFLLALAGIVYPIVGALKAQKGEYWSYPGTISFL